MRAANKSMQPTACHRFITIVFNRLRKKQKKPPLFCTHHQHHVRRTVPKYLSHFSFLLFSLIYFCSCNHQIGIPIHFIRLSRSHPTFKTSMFYQFFFIPIHGLYKPAPCLLFPSVVRPVLYLSLIPWPWFPSTTIVFSGSPPSLTYPISVSSNLSCAALPRLFAYPIHIVVLGRIPTANEKKAKKNICLSNEGSSTFPFSSYEWKHMQPVSRHILQHTA